MLQTLQSILAIQLMLVFSKMSLTKSKKGRDEIFHKIRHLMTILFSNTGRIKMINRYNTWQRSKIETDSQVQAWMQIEELIWMHQNSIMDPQSENRLIIRCTSIQIIFSGRGSKWQRQRIFFMIEYWGHNYSCVHQGCTNTVAELAKFRIPSIQVRNLLNSNICLSSVSGVTLAMLYPSAEVLPVWVSWLQADRIVSEVIVEK